MSAEYENLVRKVEGRIEDFNCDRDDAGQAARDIVSLVLTLLYTPSEAAAQVGGAAAMQASMGFQPQSMCGLAAVRGVIDHIRGDAD